MTYQTLSNGELNRLRVLMLEFFSDSSKSLSDMMADPDFEYYVDTLGENKLRDFLLGMCEPTGLIYHTGSTRGRRYRTTKRGRSMIQVYKGEAELPDPDE